LKTRVVNSRLRLLLLVILFTFAALGARAAWLQTVRASSLAAMAQMQAKKPISLPAGRGTIYDRLGNPLAIGEQATDVDADPMQISDPRREARIAAKVLGIPVRPLYRQLSDRSSGFVYVERKAPPKLAAKLMKRHLVGFTFEPDQKRVYPQGTVAAPVLGYAGTDNIGLSGLERELDKELKGTPGRATEVRDALGQAVNTIQERPARDGRDVYLTLDSHIQANAEQVLEQTVSEWHAKNATAIVLDPRSGAILGMAQEPGYNANGYPAATAHDLTIDHAVTDVFEPGSVFKVVTIGGALSQHDITPNTAFQVPGSLHVADRVIHDAEPHGTETLKVKQILQRSSNIGTDMIAGRYLGESGLKTWMARFGFGRRTGIDFPGESRGLRPSWSGSTIGTVPIGQGVSVTAIQLASTYAAIANGGEWVQPHLVDHVVGRATPKPKRRRILEPGVDAQLRAMLRGVVSDQGTAELAAIPGYAVAGKTGTAQKAGPNGYIPGAYVATFVGMVPASRPRLLVLVTIDEPHGQIYGGLVAAPAFEQIASFDLQYLEVPPDLRIK
jgi:cell division protein FtsI/penicillin-binding protein 2